MGQRNLRGEVRESVTARINATFGSSRQRGTFNPKFHCELNPVKYYWCQAKWYTREPCDYTLEGLRKTVPLALAVVERKSTIFWGFFDRSARIIEVYRIKLEYVCEEFKNRCIERAVR